MPVRCIIWRRDNGAMLRTLTRPLLEILLRFMASSLGAPGRLDGARLFFFRLPDFAREFGQNDGRFRPAVAGSDPRASRPEAASIRIFSDRNAAHLARAVADNRRNDQILGSFRAKRAFKRQVWTVAGHAVLRRRAAVAPPWRG